MSGVAHVAHVARAAGVGWRSRDALEAYRVRRLRALLRHAYQRVPYYRALFDRHGVRPEDIRQVCDLARIPVTARAEIQASSAEEVVAAGVDPEQLIAIRTSGSTGEPLTVRRTWLEQRLLHLFRLRSRRHQGIRARDRMVQVQGVRTRSPKDNKLLGNALRRFGFDWRERISATLPSEEIVARLLELRPSIVVGYPGILDRVARRISAAERERLQIRLVMTGGEVCTPLMRQRIEEGFGVPVRNNYASHEFNLIAWECPRTEALHVCDDSVIVEVLKDGEPVGPGESGEIVLTGLHTYAMPFIRYSLGDVVTRGETPCPCGAPFSTLIGIEGRALDFFPLPDGRLLHPYTVLPRLFHEPADTLRRFQLVQQRIDRVVLRVVLGTRATHDDLERWSYIISSATGPAVEVAVEPVAEISLAPSGKYRVAQSLVQRDTGPAVRGAPSAT